MLPHVVFCAGAGDEEFEVGLLNQRATILRNRPEDGTATSKVRTVPKWLRHSAGKKPDPWMCGQVSRVSSAADSHFH